MTTESASPAWFVGRDGLVHGPISAVEVATLAQLGHLRPSDFVWTAGFDQWLRAGSVPGLLPDAPPRMSFTAALRDPPPVAAAPQPRQPAIAPDFDLRRPSQHVRSSATFLARSLERIARRKLQDDWAIGAPPARRR